MPGVSRPRARSAIRLGLGAAAAGLAITAGAWAASGDLGPKGCVDDDDSGADTCFESSDGLEGARAVAVSPDGTSVYAVSDTDDAIVRFDRDPASGALDARGCIDDDDTGADDCSDSAAGLGMPFALAISPDGESVYVASRADDAIVRFGRNTNTGKLTPKGCIDDDDTGADDCDESTDGLAGANGLAISPDGAYVYATSVSDDAVVRFKRNLSSGRLFPRGCIDDDDTGADDCDESTDGLQDAWSAVTSPDGTSLYATSLLDDAVVRFDRDPANGELDPRSCFEDDGGPDDCSQSADGLDGAFGIAVSPDGTSLYVTAIEDQTLLRLKRRTNGTLADKGCFADDAAPAACAETSRALSGPTTVIVGPEGESVYVASVGDDAISIFDRNLDRGSLSELGCVEDDAGPAPCAQVADGLDGAAGVAVSGDGASLYAVSTLDDAIVRFVRDPG